MGAGLVTWWMDRSWWLRWLICLGMLVAGAFLSLWVFVIGGLLTIVNLFLTWNEVLDRFLPRRK